MPSLGRLLHAPARTSGPTQRMKQTRNSQTQHHYRTGEDSGAIRVPSAAQDGLVGLNGGLGDGLPGTLDLPAQRLPAPGCRHEVV
ncbi:hypothetical protein F751_2261 [Auxenochlorella protothecoides]|uniref:Uncharacterized protein n=1 Tax=Auxenochlorella protothecoides TaxID=3075 RepID=A0A087SFN9_AUXPR|nr:hypothetical protein F751_2261 [Auxenochlorella protothecoides]KFM24543.1 hypothetical protein F751_2261 [Auxenochlorella protothecoides]